MRTFWIIVTTVLILGGWRVREVPIEVGTSVAPVAFSTGPRDPQQGFQPGQSPESHEVLSELSPDQLRSMVRPPPRSRRAPDVPDGPSIPGEGTWSSPYIVSWETLAMASRTYRPLVGTRTLPPEVEMLDGTVVRIEGLFMAPWGESAITEVLLMRYAWDGCCIGVPPDAYSSIEVVLREASSRGDLIGYDAAALTGMFHVEPWEKGNWLLGLFEMRDATIDVSR